MGCTYSVDRKIQPSMAVARLQPIDGKFIHSQQPIRISPYEQQEPKHVNNLRAKQSAHDIIDDYS
jgi:hypothetical protein